MPFKTRPRMDYLGRGRFITTGVTVYEANDITIVIPPGFETDLASVPRSLWGLIAPSGTYEDAAVVHDYGCVDLYKAKRENRAPILNSNDVDGLLRRISREDGTSFVTRWVMWTGVRWGAIANPCRREGWLKPKNAALALSWSGGILVAVLAALYGSHLAVDLVLRLVGL